MPSSPSRSPKPTHDARVAARAVLAELADVIDEEIPGVLDRNDPEHLHDLRIAIRRTRSISRELRDVLPTEGTSVRRELFAHLAQATGEPCDLDVQVLGWGRRVGVLLAEDQVALAPVLVELEARRDDADANLRRVLESSEVTTGLASWRASLAEPAGLAHDAGPSIGTVLVERVAKRHERLLRDGRRIDATSAAERLHDLRKEAKRLRYLVECFGPVFGAKERRAYLRQMKDLQDHLGAHQDAEVQGTYLRGLARALNDGSPTATDVVLAVGRLIDQVDRVRVEERAAFAVWFAAYDSAKTAKVLDRLIASVAGDR